MANRNGLKIPVLLILTLISINTAMAAASLLYDYRGNYKSSIDVYGNHWLAQPFTANETYILEYFSIEGNGKGGAVSGYCSYSIYNANEAKPTTINQTYINFDVSSHNGTRQFRNYTLASPLNMASGDIKALVVNCTIGGADRYQFTYNNLTIPVYKLMYTDDLGVTWLNASPTADNDFRLVYYGYHVYNYSYIYNIDFYNYSKDAGTNYTRGISYYVDVSCPMHENASIGLYINDSLVRTDNVTCDGSRYNITGYYRLLYEGPYNASIYYNSTNTSVSGWKTKNQSFTWDLYNPMATLNYTSIGGFNDSVNVTIRCVDSVFNNLSYTLSINSNPLMSTNYSNNTLAHNITNLINDSNTLVGVCSDPFGNDTETLTFNLYKRTIILIDEVDNSDFDVSNLSSVRVYFDDNSSYYDFKTAGTNKVNFTSTTNDKLRFELVYLAGDVITRFVDISLTDDPLRVCANEEGVNHIEQYVISASQREAVISNVYSTCIVVADYTRFAYQDSYVLRYYTIDSEYSLYTVDGGADVFLANIDGGVANQINIDYLEFSQQGYNINILEDAISFKDAGGNITQIFYTNLAGDNAQVNVLIKQLDTGSYVYAQNVTTNPNNFTIYFNYASLNITNETLFKIEMTKILDDGTEETANKYFNTQAASGILTRGFAMVISILLTLFGLSFAGSKVTFSWFGILVCILSIGILTFATAAWYTIFLQAINVIILVFIFITMIGQNQGAVS